MCKTKASSTTRHWGAAGMYRECTGAVLAMGQSACDCAVQNRILDRITSCYICYICKSVFAVLHGHMHEVQIRHQVHTWSYVLLPSEFLLCSCTVYILCPTYDTCDSVCWHKSSASAQAGVATCELAGMLTTQDSLLKTFHQAHHLTPFQCLLPLFSSYLLG